MEKTDWGRWYGVRGWVPQRIVVQVEEGNWGVSVGGYLEEWGERGDWVGW